MFKGKKLLLFGLGVLGGGVETAKFLLKQGVKLSVTDAKNKRDLSSSISKLPKNISYTLGGHKESDIKKADIVVFNQGVPFESAWVKKALALKKPILSDLSLFLLLLREKKKTPDYIAVTGTRGKTTTTMWINHFIPDSVVGGNMPENGLLKIISKKTNLFALELSSFQLEYVQKDSKAPKVALITNLYRDHLNRYKKMEKYAQAKAKIFASQDKSDFLVLNADNEWSDFFLKQKPKSQVYWFSLKKLPPEKKGMYLLGNKLVWRDTNDIVVGTSPFSDIAHNSNLLASLTASYLYGASWFDLVQKVDTLPQVPLRQEVVIENKKIKVVNDGAATSPDATVALLDSYKLITKENKILITGGTDKDLEYGEWVKKIVKEIAPQNLFLLSGSATVKMVEALSKEKFWKKERPRLFESYKDMLDLIHLEDGVQKVVLFSPSAASFEKFKNEFDRSEKFMKILYAHLLTLE